MNDSASQTRIPPDIQTEQQRLIQAVHRQIGERSGNKRTNRLSSDEQRAANIYTPYATKVGHPELYEPVPLERAQDEIARTRCWRIELHGLSPSAGPVGFDILGDAILGRGADVVRVDIDLEPYRAAEKGVSRQHAMLRPSAHALYLFDLSSTNGTQCNGILLGAGIARVLSHQDTICLGHLTFEIKLVEGPGAQQNHEGQHASES
jgi:hypothetical protein